MYSKHVCVYGGINEVFQSSFAYFTAHWSYYSRKMANLWLQGLVAMVTRDTILALNQNTICREYKRPYFLHTLRNNVSVLTPAPDFWWLIQRLASASFHARHFTNILWKRITAILIISEIQTFVLIVQQQSGQKAEKEGKDSKRLITSGFDNRSWMTEQNITFIYRCQNWQEQADKVKDKDKELHVRQEHILFNCFFFFHLQRQV